MALALFMGLTFLELGIGVTTIPKMTAIMALVMFSLSFIYLILFERKAFCRYGCPVGRTLGFYSRIAPLSLRPRQQLTCDNCKTLECYRGSEKYEPCPTSLTIGKFSQNTYCISCGNCVLNCPYDNVSWRLRPMGSEAKEGAHPTWDGAWFMLILLGITTFHGVTMWPYWSPLVILFANAIGETGKLYWSFTILMFIGFALPVLVYAVAVVITRLVARIDIKYKQVFVALSFSALPLAFTYHLAHNMNHLFREGGGILALFFNPLGIGLDPMTDAERHMEMMDTPPVDLIFGLQAGLIIIGIFLSVHILRHRGARILPNQPGITGWQLSPMLVFVTMIASVNVWLLSQEMVMRF
jgi:ferredoxin